MFVTHFGARGFLRLYFHPDVGLTSVVRCCCIVFLFARVADGPGGCRVLHLIFQLAADDGASILIVEALCLTANLCIKSLYQSQVFRIVAPHLQRLGEEPVRKATTAYLTVTEWADTDNDGHLVLLTELEEVA